MHARLSSSWCDSAPAWPWRRTAACAALAYVGLASAALAGWLVATGRAPALHAAVISALPLVLVIWLVVRHQTDDRQFVVQLLSSIGFAPVLLGFWAAGEAAPGGAAAWPVLLPAAVLHAAAFVATVFWLGTAATRVPAARGSAAVEASELWRRLTALQHSGARCTLHGPGSDTGDALEAGHRLVFMLHPPGPARSHGVFMRLDPARRCVHVAERLGAAGAAPQDADEASLRRVGDPLPDTARPPAQRVWGMTRQATLIDPQRLATLTQRMAASGVARAATDATALDAEGTLTLLCAVVTTSGWDWSPAWTV